MTKRSTTDKRSKTSEFAAGLQELVSSEEKAAFSPRVLAEASNPRNVGRLQNANAQASFKGPCGDTMEFHLRIASGRVKKISFMTDGCGASIATGSMLTRLVGGKSLKAAAALTENRLLEALGGLPKEHRHCAKLAVTTLRMALAGYTDTKKKTKSGRK